jgi:large subunit ribosomal protein L7/L12
METGTGPQYAVTLTDLGHNKIDVIKAIREYTDLGLKEAKELAESAPAVVCSGVSQETAEEIRRDLEDAGARARVRGV